MREVRLSGMVTQNDLLISCDEIPPRGQNKFPFIDAEAILICDPQSNKQAGEATGASLQLFVFNVYTETGDLTVCTPLCNLFSDVWGLHHFLSMCEGVATAVK